MCCKFILQLCVTLLNLMVEPGPDYFKRSKLLKNFTDVNSSYFNRLEIKIKRRRLRRTCYTIFFLLSKSCFPLESLSIGGTLPFSSGEIFWWLNNSDKNPDNFPSRSTFSILLRNHGVQKKRESYKHYHFLICHSPKIRNVEIPAIVNIGKKIHDEKLTCRETSISRKWIVAGTVPSSI